MLSTTRRTFASRIAYLFTGVGAASLIAGSPQAAAEEQGGVRKAGLRRQAYRWHGILSRRLLFTTV